MTFDLKFDLERISFITVHLPKKLTIDPNFLLVEDLRNVVCFFTVKSANEKRKNCAFYAFFGLWHPILTPKKVKFAKIGSTARCALAWSIIQRVADFFEQPQFSPIFLPSGEKVTGGDPYAQKWVGGRS